MGWCTYQTDCVDRINFGLLSFPKKMKREGRKKEEKSPHPTHHHRSTVQQAPNSHGVGTFRLMSPIQTPTQHTVFIEEYGDFLGDN